MIVHQLGLDGASGSGSVDRIDVIAMSALSRPFPDVTFPFHLYNIGI